MQIRLRTLFFAVVSVLVILFIYFDRAILTPFVLAAIFAYIFNPVVNFFSNKIRLPRSLSILIIYLVIISAVVFLSAFLVQRILSESTELKNYTVSAVKTARAQINALPDFIKPTVNDALVSLEKSKIFSSNSLLYFFPRAISRLISLFMFLFASFYFLREGNTMLDKLLKFISRNRRVEIEILLRRMNMIFGSYLRGQLFLVFVVSLMLYICLLILGVKYALFLAVFSGFAEIVPIIGPIVAGAAATFVVLTNGVSNFALPPIQAAIVVIIIYFVIRHFEDYFIIPHVMGKVTNLHPLIILFAVISGGHLWGVLGLILAVPIAAAVKILLEFSLDKLNSK
jgi:predicted PurR-regulated permease PerM